MAYSTLWGTANRTTFDTGIIICQKCADTVQKKTIGGYYLSKKTKYVQETSNKEIMKHEFMENDNSMGNKPESLDNY